MKIFISIGMRYKSAEQIHEEMEKVFKKIKTKLPEAELIDTIIDGADKDIALKGENIALWYLARSIELMVDADLVFFVNNYMDFRGCRIEKIIAEDYGKFCEDIKVDLD